MGSARLVSGLATRLRPEEGLQLSPGYVARWRELRAELERRRESRRKQRRFRHDPADYLAKLEQQCLQLTLPP
jgi:phage regulator Rha-like protein